MKVLLISDSHGNNALLRNIIEKVKADFIIHCGDSCTDIKSLPKIDVIVKGNCDFYPFLDEKIIDIANFPFFITHGHLYNVKTSLLRLYKASLKKKVKIICFGHSHIPFLGKKNNMLFLNPGSITKPRKVTTPTYALLNLKYPFVSCDFFSVKQDPYPLKGDFSLE